MMHYQLFLAAGPDAGTRFALSRRDTLLIGRGTDCGLVLRDASVSRVHCRIVTEGDRIVLEDAGSRWGTTVNGAPASTVELKPGDLIVLGDTHIRLDAVTPTGTVVARTGVAAATETISEDFVAVPIADSIPAAPAARPSSPKKPASRKDAPKQASPSERVRLPKIRRPDSLVGEMFLRYRVGSIVARARSGVVFRALDTRHSHPVALKVFQPDFFPDERARQRFLRGVRTMMPIEHENLIRLHSAGRTRGVCFTVSEFVEGESASELIRQVGVAGMLDWRRVWHIAVGVAKALEFAHDRGIIHRNVLPTNVLVRKSDGCVKLGDLMLAKAFADAGAAGITRPGELVGEVCYVAPEQLSDDRPADGRSDIYSLGVTLYALLTGHPPFEGPVSEVVRRALAEAPEPPTRQHLAIPPLFEGLVLRMLAKRPEHRYDSATALLRDLERVGKFQGLDT